MIRVVLTVLVAVALLSVSMPALEDARVGTTDERLGTESDRIERAIGALSSGSRSVSDPSLAARTTITVRSPSGLTAARIDRLAIVEPERSRNGPGAALRYRIRGGRDRTVSIVPDAATATVEVVDGPIPLRTRGESRLGLRLVDDAGPTVEIARVG
ncbi:DUF7311 family protein [Halorubrum lipolyticum]|uniref:DUF7311 domain-containing protein n=1 Tax=Halorubrum lipolyticum DSM 21995 TaxID=1227482 RepID=M0NX45_9EURY|nr:hypothetical protein [Halorubrum lipolyticum]EMA61150.1 hypothetical protein C469_07762 [Halorubrum lipolyticum DSM 21995]